MPQNFINQIAIKNNKFEADIDESRHIMKVARHKIGDEIKIFNGAGKRYLAIIDLYERKRVSGSIKSEIVASIYKTHITLCFAPTQKTAIEKILEHCVETGVSCFVPIITSRTQRNYLDKWSRKKTRFKEILLAASKQSERSFVPDLLEPKTFREIFDDEDIVFFATPDGDFLGNCGADFKNVKAAKIIIGPEGGFTSEEIAFAKTKKAVFIKISRHILRSETAAIAASALLLNRADENIF